MIRRGRKKERKSLPKSPTEMKVVSIDDVDDSRVLDFKRYSSTFDNIRSLLKESKIEDLSEPPTSYKPCIPPDLVRVVSLPVISHEVITNREHLDMNTVEEEESSDLSDKEKERQSEHSDDLVEMTSFAKRSQECNGLAKSILPNSKSLDVKLTSVSKIPVNVLIEDQIVKKALNENRRQLEKVSDAIKEIESVKNSESYIESYIEGKRWRNVKNNAKRNSYENDCERRLFDSARTKKQHSSDSETSKTSSEIEFDRRKINGAEVYASGRRPRQNGIESHKNDQKQIENVIDAILEDSKNPDFKVLDRLF